MQVVTCHIGETVRIGNDLSVTLQSRSGGRVTVSVITPPDVDLTFDNVCLRPSILPSAARSYLFSMLAVRRFRVGEIEIQVWLPGEAVSLAAECDDYLHIGIGAPKACRITREQNPQSLCPIASPLHT